MLFVDEYKLIFYFNNLEYLLFYLEKASLFRNLFWKKQFLF